jgi:membrane-anchored protein YejM (alkaline phosphatase superfamily)
VKGLLLPTRRADLTQLRWAIAGQCLLSAVVLAATATSYLSGIDLSVLSPEGRLFSRISFGAYFLELHLLVFAFVWGLSLVLRGKSLLWICAALIGAVQLFFYVDLRVFALLRFHVNRYVLHFLLEPSALLHTGVPVQHLLAPVALLAIAVAATAAVGRVLSHAVEGHLRPRRRTAVVLLSLCAVGLAGDKAAYAYFAHVEIEPVSDVALALPLYPRASARKLLTRMGVVPNKRRFDYSPPFGTPVPESRRAVYPPSAVAQVSPSARERPNIVILGVESFRADVIEESAAPNLTAFRARALDARHHVSGSNCTHLGLFSLLYAVGGFNWEVARQSKSGPFPVKVLRELGYEVRWANSVPLDFFNIEEFMFDSGEQLAKYNVADWPSADRQMNEDLKAYLRRPHGRPFLLYGFYVSPHHNYLYPPEHERFGPVVPPTFSHRDLSLSRHRVELFNRYKNSVHFVDALIGEVLTTLRQAGLEENTAVIVTGDHGESFFEDGRFTHASGFADVQVRVPLMMRLPGLAPRVLDEVTSHVDVFPTLFSHMGVNLKPEDYSDGRSMLDGGSPFALVSGCYYTTPVEYAVVKKEGFLSFRLEHGRLAVAPPQDPRGGPRAQSESLAAREQLALMAALKEMQRFAR